jgi:uncharacterized protein YndB with AHSA1/START domain
MRGKIILFPRRPVTHWRLAYRQLWLQRLDRLARHVETLKRGVLRMSDDLKIEAPENSKMMFMTRTFDAPRELVWRALSEPEHVVRWFGPDGYPNTVLEFDWRVGGKWRIRTEIPGGEDITFFGDYLEIEKPVKVTQTFSFDHLPPGMHSIDTVELEEKDGKTIYRASSTFPDIESRNGMLASGMETGVREGFARLDAMLEDWKATV